MWKNFLKAVSYITFGACCASLVLIFTPGVVVPVGAVLALPYIAGCSGLISLGSIAYEYKIEEDEKFIKKRQEECEKGKQDISNLKKNQKNALSEAMKKDEIATFEKVQKSLEEYKLSVEKRFLKIESNAHTQELKIDAIVHHNSAQKKADSRPTQRQKEASKPPEQTPTGVNTEPCLPGPK